MLKIKRLLLILLSMTSLLVGAQPCQVKAKLDSTHILIGDYLNVHLTVKAPASTQVVFPTVLPNQLDSIELIGVSKIDTLAENNWNTYNQTITVTAFDSGSYVFPAISVFSTDSQCLGTTNPLPFEVTTLPVDTTLAIKDINQPVRVPLTFKEVLPVILIILGIILLIALIVYMIMRFAKNRKPKEVKVISKPKVKPHITALAQLEELRRKKLWEVGNVKEYYSELTDIIRTYMEGRWDIYAMEMVTEEIMGELHRINLSPEVCAMMKQILETADLVKFAKWQPLPNDHDLCFKDAVDFVKATAEQANESGPKKSEVEK